MTDADRKHLTAKPEDFDVIYDATSERVNRHQLAMDEYNAKPLTVADVLKRDEDIEIVAISSKGRKIALCWVQSRQSWFVWAEQVGGEYFTDESAACAEFLRLKGGE